MAGHSFGRVFHHDGKRFLSLCAFHLAQISPVPFLQLMWDSFYFWGEYFPMLLQPQMFQYKSFKALSDLLIRLSDIQAQLLVSDSQVIFV